MKKIKITLSLLAVVVSMGAAIANNASRKLLYLTIVSVKNLPGCDDVGACTLVSPFPICRTQVGENTFITFATITTIGGIKTCSVAALGVFIPYD